MADSESGPSQPKRHKMSKNRNKLLTKIELEKIIWWDFGKYTHKNSSVVLKLTPRNINKVWTKQDGSCSREKSDYKTAWRIIIFATFSIETNNWFLHAQMHYLVQLSPVRYSIKNISKFTFWDWIWDYCITILIAHFSIY